MAQFPIQTGVRVKDGSLRKSYPLNLRHKVVESGVSKGQLVSARGARQLSTGPGTDRGGIVWRDKQHRVMGDKLVSVAEGGGVTILATVPNDGLPCRFVIGFDHLGILAGERMFLFDGSTLVEGPSAGQAVWLDLAWLAGYFVLIDGEYIVPTELNAPTTIDPLRYGSAESYPDPLTGVETLGEELVAFGRHSIQFFRNVGGTGFPFQAIAGATIPFGCVSATAKCRIGDTIAFVGGAPDEPLGVFILRGGQAVRISDEELDDMLPANGTGIVMESRSFGSEREIIVHTDESSFALTMAGSDTAGEGLWHVLKSRTGRYRPRNAVWFMGQHYVGDASGNALGVIEDKTAHFGEEPGWSFDAGLMFNDTAGVIIHAVEVTGQFPTTPSSVFFSMTHDGETWSREIGRALSGRGSERIVWGPHVRVSRMAGFRFRGFGQAAISRLDVGGEGLTA